jgi:transcriptional regulator with XRE-family HTH domain
MKRYSEADLIRILREKIKFGHTQAELAAELHIFRATLNRVLHAKQAIPAKVADALGFRKLPDAYVRKRGAK